MVALTVRQGHLPPDEMSLKTWEQMLLLLRDELGRKCVSDWHVAKAAVQRVNGKSDALKDHEWLVELLFGLEILD
jgi:hypothetical protein